MYSAICCSREESVSPLESSPTASQGAWNFAQEGSKGGVWDVHVRLILALGAQEIRAGTEGDDDHEADQEGPAVREKHISIGLFQEKCSKDKVSMVSSIGGEHERWKDGGVPNPRIPHSKMVTSRIDGGRYRHDTCYHIQSLCFLLRFFLSSMERMQCPLSFHRRTEYYPQRKGSVRCFLNAIVRVGSKKTSHATKGQERRLDACMRSWDIPVCHCIFGIVIVLVSQDVDRRRLQTGVSVSVSCVGRELLSTRHAVMNGYEARTVVGRGFALDGWQSRLVGEPEMMTRSLGVEVVQRSSVTLATTEGSEHGMRWSQASEVHAWSLKVEVEGYLFRSLRPNCLIRLCC